VGESCQGGVDTFGWFWILFLKFKRFLIIKSFNRNNEKMERKNLKFMENFPGSNAKNLNEIFEKCLYW
jgi:hypothetical protein